LQVREGTQNHRKKRIGTVNVPELFPDSSVGIPKPTSGRIGTDAIFLGQTLTIFGFGSPVKMGCRVIGHPGAAGTVLPGAAR
jgi:hypothetical protein